MGLEKEPVSRRQTGLKKVEKEQEGYWKSGERAEPGLDAVVGTLSRLGPLALYRGGGGWGQGYQGGKLTPLRPASYLDSKISVGVYPRLAAHQGWLTDYHLMPGKGKKRLKARLL